MKKPTICRPALAPLPILLILTACSGGPPRDPEYGRRCSASQATWDRLYRTIQWQEQTCHRINDASRRERLTDIWDHLLLELGEINSQICEARLAGEWPDEQTWNRLTVIEAALQRMERRIAAATRETRG